MFFRANDGNTGWELWAYENIQDTMFQVYDINPGTESAGPSLNTTFNDKMYFVADNGISGKELWEYDGVNDPVQTCDINQFTLSSDPVEMTKVVREVDQPCLGFKILAAGRAGFSRDGVEQAFKFAFENIKKTDGVIVGMYPRFKDEITENAQFTVKYGKLE